MVYLAVTQDVIIVCLNKSNTRRYHCVFIYQENKTLSLRVYLPVTRDFIIVCIFSSNTRRYHYVFISENRSIG
jgi:hypothetical protein